MNHQSRIEKDYLIAKEQYAVFDIDTEQALSQLSQMAISLHCWQADDVGGFESPDASLAGSGLQVTGNYPGKARNIEELRMDLAQSLRLIPGRHRLNLHAIYGEFGGQRVDRDAISPEHFRGWVDWAKQQRIKLDFNATCFSHPNASQGFTLSHRDRSIRSFWIEHVKRCRDISAFMGRELNSPCIHNLWIPDGTKDAPVDRWTPRTLLKESLDEIFAREYRPTEMKDAIESKLFGIGSESYVVGSHEFYLSYAIARRKMVCLDMGHFHPTESIADKISAILQFSDELLLHVSRGIRWDSDHVVILNDDLKSVAEEIVRASALQRVHIALDYFDASMNRVAAYVIGTRATLKALLMALLEPRAKLQECEISGDHWARLALLEEIKTLPFGAVWDYYCLKHDVPIGTDWMNEVKRYEQQVLLKRR
ncbi:MAG: L-rhamnose isomerase [candidate division KSB1 bacterium]|nr:L-rhamnose isomerase [candidate division KSB1 bacterium]MDZ7318417.1 L-rhamnose isomerase [candidate division KSB1 bacterium]MDZ7341247.1 L-rhamnose isomerase [candidate division KSB1 bacterium]